MVSRRNAQERLYFNGINGDRGEYDLRPLAAAELLDFIVGGQPPQNLAGLRRRRQQKFAVRAGVDPRRLDQTGWGAILPQDADPAVVEALGDLLALRRDQAGDRFRLFHGADGYRPGESKTAFLARHGAGPGPVAPATVPYYLLLVGSPQQVPYRFHTQLDVQYAVGRLHFDTPEAYAAYARTVVAAETGTLRRPRRVTFFGVANPDDHPTALSTRELVTPLADELQARVDGWQIDRLLGEPATKACLARLLGGPETPTLLFTAGHGMGFEPGSPRQLPHQGALLCQDWPGPDAWHGPIPERFYFAGDDLDAAIDLQGLIAFFFACFGAGTPQYDAFSRRAPGRERPALAPHPFLARLPAAMLAHGALAVVGHVERAWSYSFRWPGAGAQTTVFESTLERLLAGDPVGAALEDFNRRYAELATILGDELEDVEAGKLPDPRELAGLWTANNDARGYAIVGDPAVRLPVPVEETAGPRKQGWT